LKNKTNINERDDEGLTALHVATATENLEMIKTLGTILSMTPQQFFHYPPDP
jgi:hypothetical protein